MTAFAAALAARIEATTGLALAAPEWLAAAPLVVLLFLVLRRVWRRPSFAFAPAFLAADLPRSRRQRTAALPTLVEMAALLVGVVALARPVRREPLPPERAGSDLLLVLDVSSSMQARDLERTRSRLDVAKETAARFIAARDADRIGLVAFARYPDLIVPPTRDHAALQTALAQVTRVESDGPEDATALGTAVARAADLLARVSGRNRVVILLSDGDENVATAAAPQEIAPYAAAQLCVQLGVRVHGIRAGADAAAPARAAAPSDTLALLAQRTGGEFAVARDAAALAQIFDHLGQVEGAPDGAPRFALRAQLVPFLVVAAALLVGAGLLRATLWSELP